MGEDHGSIELGTVGWVDDGGTYFEQGSGSNDGYTLVRVTLFRGKDPSLTLDQTQAQGKQLVVTLGSGVNRIPPRGTRVMVGLPAGMRDLPGAGCILATMDKSFASTGQFSPNRVVMDFGDSPVVIRGSCVTLQSTASAPQSFSVGTPPGGGNPGIYALDETGSGITVQSGVIGLFATDNGSPPDAKLLVQLTKSGVDVMNKTGGSQFQMDAQGNITVLGTAFNALTAGGILGANAATGAFAVTTIGGVPAPSAHWLLGA